MTKKLRISFCTTCMNRRHHIAKTFKKNIEDNIDQKELYDLEFVLLDYNSTDKLDEWVASEVSNYVESGIVKYYRYEGAKAYHRSHSRNLAIRLSSGDIVCNLDADNYTGKSFAMYIYNVFTKSTKIFMSANGPNQIPSKDVLGRIVIAREDFFRIGGYDEGIDGYGFEDIDLSNRLEKFGMTRYVITKLEHLQFEAHKDIERYKNEYNFKFVKYVMIRYLTPNITEVAILMTNGTFKFIVLKDPFYFYKDFMRTNEESGYLPLSDQTDWLVGKADYSDRKINLHFLNGEYIEDRVLFAKKINLNKSAYPISFTMVRKSDMYDVIARVNMIINYQKMMYNKTSNRLVVNNAKFGHGTVINYHKLKISL